MVRCEEVALWQGCPPPTPPPCKVLGDERQKGAAGASELSQVPRLLRRDAREVEELQSRCQGETIVLDGGSSDSGNVIVPSSSSSSTIVIKKEPPKVVVVKEESPIVIQVK
ncbi:uncharacterized protein LOC144118938 isoform X2 [Amblyomma americanum]